MKKSVFLILVATLFIVTSCNKKKNSSSVNSEDISTTEDIVPILDGKHFDIHSLEMCGTYGDANLIQYNGFDVLVDGGTYYDGANLNAMLRKYVTDGVLDLIIISHPDSDHYSGISSGNALAGLSNVNRMIINGTHPDNNRVKKAVSSAFPSVAIDMAAELTSESKPTYTIKVDSDFSIDIMYNPLYDNNEYGKNDQSIPAIFKFRNARLFMGGDMETNSCDKFRRAYPDLFNEKQFVIFKGLHHGSNGTNMSTFLRYIKPDMCFVNAPLQTSGNNNIPSYNVHPYLDAMVRMGNQTPNVYWSGVSGNLTIECNGYEATVTGDTRTTDYYYYNMNNEYELVDRSSEANITYFQSYYYRMAIERQNKPDFAGILSK